MQKKKKIKKKEINQIKSNQVLQQVWLIDAWKSFKSSDVNFKAKAETTCPWR